MTRKSRRVEWPTWAALAICYGVWGGSLFAPVPLGIFGAALAIALHASLQHEIIHGHPTRRPWLNAALVFPALGLLIPYLRFRDTHLAHHHDADLTDPYDDPESNYLDPAVWRRLGRPLRAVLRVNNTLLGRVVIGVVVSQVGFMLSDWRQRDRAVARGWLWHLPAAALVLGLVGLSSMPLWAYLVACYLGLSVIKLRTFLEHQAHLRAAGRTVIIEDKGPLAFLFLNNNLHAVHHAKPELPWYRLPQVYAAGRARFLAMNGGYRYGSYREIIARHLLRPKDSVPHPLWR